MSIVGRPGIQAGSPFIGSVFLANDEPKRHF